MGTYPSSGGQLILIEGAERTRLWSLYLGNGHLMGIDAQDVDVDGDMDVAVENYDNEVFPLDVASLLFCIFPLLLPLASMVGLFNDQKV